MSEKKKELAERNAKKFGCYVMEVGHKDMTMHEIKMLSLNIESSVNEVSKEPNYKSQY